jgi:hypothetical protein
MFGWFGRLFGRKDSLEDLRQVIKIAKFVLRKLETGDRTYLKHVLQRMLALDLQEKAKIREEIKSEFILEEVQRVQNMIEQAIFELEQENIEAVRTVLIEIINLEETIQVDLAIEQRKNKEIRTQRFLIPTAYIYLPNDDLAKRLLQRGYKIRYNKTKYWGLIEITSAYLFLENEETRRLLEEAKQATKAMNKALQKELNKRGIKVWVLFRGRPKTKKDCTRMDFMIRPMYFSSKDTKDEDKMDWIKNRPQFIFHFDQENQIQRIRFHSKTEEINEFQKDFLLQVNRYYLGLEECYGNWEDFVKIIATTLEEISQQDNFQKDPQQKTA